MTTPKRSRRKKSSTRSAGPPRSAARPQFVGRDPSPVLDQYPPKVPSSTPRPAPPPVIGSTASPTSGATPRPTTAAPPAPSAQPLITLDRPFDLDEFSSLLGGTSIRVTVPREALPEVLHRVLEFMGFGIYVYSVSVRPAPAELLKAFVVELQRVDYSPEKGAWVPFVEKGTTNSPFGPSGNRT